MKLSSIPLFSMHGGGVAKIQCTIPSGVARNYSFGGWPEFGTIPSGGGQNSSGQISIF